MRRWNSRAELLLVASSSFPQRTTAFGIQPHLAWSLLGFLIPSAPSELGLAIVPSD